MTGPTSVFASRPLPTRSFLTFSTSFSTELFVDLFVNDQPRRSRAALPAGAERSPQRAFDGVVDIGVVHHDDRVLAAHLERDDLVVARTCSAMMRPVSVEPVNEIRRTSWMVDERRADVCAVAVDEIDDAFRNARFFARFDEIESRKRHVLARFDDDRVAADERRDQLPRRDRHREIERRDQPAKPDRLADAHREFVRHLGRRRKAVQTPAFARRVIGAVDRFLHVAAGFLQNLAHLAGHVARELRPCSRAGSRRA